MIAVSAKEEWDYVLEQERGTENPTTFRCKQLTLRARTEAEDILRADRLNTELGSFKLCVLHNGLIGWKNMHDASGAEVKPTFRRDGTLDDKSLVRIPSDQMLQIAWEIFNVSAVSEEDRKN